MIAVQGPQSREVIAPLVGGIQLDGQAFPHMSVRVGTVCGVPCRLFRVSFTGELGYEINVPSDYGQPVWEAVMESGRELGITPYGTEAMHVLRAEKGYIVVGQETDGTVTPDDLGMGGLVAKSKPDFVGCRSLTRPDLISPGRKHLVGILTEEGRKVLEEGAQIVGDPKQKLPMHMLGHVTSSYWSATCDRSIALALVAGGRSLIGRKVYATTPGGFAEARICAPVFFDREGERVHG